MGKNITQYSGELKNNCNNDYQEIILPYSKYKLDAKKTGVTFFWLSEHKIVTKHLININRQTMMIYRRMFEYFSQSLCLHKIGIILLFLGRGG